MIVQIVEQLFVLPLENQLSKMSLIRFSDITKSVMGSFVAVASFSLNEIICSPFIVHLHFIYVYINSLHYTVSIFHWLHYRIKETKPNRALCTVQCAACTT